MSVAESLGLTIKRAKRILAAFAAKHRIRESFAQQGKVQIKVCLHRAAKTGLVAMMTHGCQALLERCSCTLWQLPTFPALVSLLNPGIICILFFCLVGGV